MQETACDLADSQAALLVSGAQRRCPSHHTNANPNQKLCCLRPPPPPQVDVAPTWRQALQHNQQQHSVAKGVGTDPVQVQDSDVQTTDRCDAGCQASTSGRRSSSSVSAQRSRADQHMQAFLHSVEPSMLAALSANSEAADGSAGRLASQATQRQVCVPLTSHVCVCLRCHQQQAATCDHTARMRCVSLFPVLQESARCLFTLTAFSSSNLLSSHSSRQSTLGRTNPHKLQVTSLSWSKSGQTLAASFGR